MSDRLEVVESDFWLVVDLLGGLTLYPHDYMEVLAQWAPHGGLMLHLVFMGEAAWLTVLVLGPEGGSIFFALILVLLAALFLLA